MSGEMDKHILKEAAAAFATDGEAISCQRYGSGHINDTFRLICEKHPYILQRMNTDIFQDPVSLMRNIEGVTTFLRQEVMKNKRRPGPGDPESYQDQGGSPLLCGQPGKLLEDVPVH